MSERLPPVGEPTIATGALRYRCLVERDALRVTGPEAGKFLQGQLTQDVLTVDLGAHRWSWLLEPAGRVVALLRVFHPGENEWVLESDPGWGEAISVRLNRFKLRTKADIEAMPAKLLCCRGAGWNLDGPLVAEPPWPGVLGVDRLYLDDVPAVEASASGDDSLGALALLEAQRIAVGQPRMGAEITERTIPAETGIVEWTVSFTKGCYTGQELVARIDSRGNHVPRKMVRLRLDGEVAAGSEMFDADGASVVAAASGVSPGAAGRITSVGLSPSQGWVGLGYLERKAGSPVSLVADGVPVRVIG